MEIINGWIFTSNRQLNLNKIAYIKLSETTLYFYFDTDDEETRAYEVFSTEAAAQTAFDTIKTYLQTNPL